MTINIYHLTQFLGQEFTSASLGTSDEDFSGHYDYMPVGVASSEGLTGARRIASKMVHYAAGELVLAFGRKSGFHPVGLSRGCFNVLATSQLALFRVDYSRESKVENSMSL